MDSLAQRGDWIAHYLKGVFQQHDRELVPVLRRLIPADGVVFDVGAQAGQMAKLFSRLAPKGRIYAFEPSDYALSILRPALRWSGARNVEVVTLGLSDAAGEAVLHTPVKGHGGLGYGLASLGADARRPTVAQTIATTTLDLFAAERGLTRLDLLKIDVEGWEAHVLRGASETLARFRPPLFIEVVEAYLARAGSSPGEIWAQLEPLGYRTRRAPDFAETDGFAGPGDYLLVAN